MASDLLTTPADVIDLLKISMLDKGKSFERMRRKATGLSFQFENMVAGLPGEGGIS
jgi:hypothetical protein